MNVDTHAPFTGFDVDKEYDSFRTDDIYETVLKSADYYIGKLISYIESIDNNTIVVLIGDHGAREHPTYNAA